MQFPISRGMSTPRLTKALGQGLKSQPCLPCLLLLLFPQLTPCLLQARPSEVRPQGALALLLIPSLMVPLHVSSRRLPQRPERLWPPHLRINRPLQFLCRPILLLFLIHGYKAALIQVPICRGMSTP